MLDSICCPYLLITCKCLWNMRILISDLMAKHCKLYLKILLTFLVPSIFLSLRLIKRVGRKRRSEWTSVVFYLELRAEERMVIQMK